VNICWFRRDLRLADNAALYHALKSSAPVVPVFCFDNNILDKLENRADARVQFIHAAILDMQAQLEELGSTLDVFYGKPAEMFVQLTKKYKIQHVFTNGDYEQYALDRDQAIGTQLAEKNISFQIFKDHVLLEKNEVLKDDGKPYTVFTPYSRKWKTILTPYHLKTYPTEKYFSNFYKQPKRPIISLEAMGFSEQTNIEFPRKTVAKAIFEKYTVQRDFPAIKGTSQLGVHLRFGTISIRKLAATAGSLNNTYLNELIWRDFYHMISWHFPQVRKGKSFRPEYDFIEWRNNEEEFKHWCNGSTGYPIVDAGMRELNNTGYMHNRVRMIVASFLTKHLLIDWRWGEAYFASKLLDFDFAANNGGWQWAAGSGCDAAPYFRVFNPTLQTEKFDKNLAYIRKWVPELDSLEYPKPIVPHELARKRALEVYAKTLKPAS
jgi:deoxyribodipyrimidine photo-lyase